ncbi:hypothetical protein [Bradyrhizobium sp. AZCC 2289]|uniref:hypothetical protein n=1 Tax=Bradyrhizobium sp. AZCC 2289 TaxID=3117026 RepID=UPI002FF3438E
MTPFELGRGHDLDIERQRFGNEWLFKWYCLNMEGKTVDVPSYDGGRITIGGVLFQGQAQSIYWQAIGRYLNGKVHETFQKWDQETRSYPPALRASSLDGTERIARQFVAGVAERSLETFRAVAGRGVPVTEPPHEGSGMHSRANLEILRLVQAHGGLLSSVQGAEVKWWRRLVDALNIKPGMFGMNIDLKKLFGRQK